MEENQGHLSVLQPMEASVCLFVVFVGSDNRHAKALEACVRKHPGSFLVDLIDTNLSRLSCEV